MADKNVWALNVFGTANVVWNILKNEPSEYR